MQMDGDQSSNIEDRRSEGGGFGGGGGVHGGGRFWCAGMIAMLPQTRIRVIDNDRLWLFMV